MTRLDDAPVRTQAPAKGPGRAGRNLPVAIAVGVVLAAVVLVPLFTYRPAFVAVVVVAIAVGVVELVRAVRVIGARLPVVPLLAGSVAMDLGAFFAGTVALLLALAFTVLAVLIWRLAGPPTGYLRDVAIASFAAVYVSFLSGFAALLTAADDGSLRIIAFVATVVASDIGGYAVGVLAGRHPMVPRISPKKSWEGLAGSLAACVGCGALSVSLGLGGAWWQGAVFGLAVAISATLGDLIESMVKRDLGVKDMGTLLPGHGGIMDRLDSLLPAAPVAWALLTLFVPPN